MNPRPVPIASYFPKGSPLRSMLAALRRLGFNCVKIKAELSGRKPTSGQNSVSTRHGSVSIPDGFHSRGSPLQTWRSHGAPRQLSRRPPPLPQLPVSLANSPTVSIGGALLLYWRPLECRPLDWRPLYFHNSSHHSGDSRQTGDFRRTDDFCCPSNLFLQIVAAE